METIIKKLPINANGEQFIQITHTEYNELGIGARTSGFAVVKPELADKLVAGLKSGALTYEFGAKNRQSGVYDVQISEAVAAEVGTTELATK